MIAHNPRHTEWQARARRHTRTRPSYRAVARQMGGVVERADGYVTITFPAPGEAEAYASWLRRVRRHRLTYTGGVAVVVKL